MKRKQVLPFGFALHDFVHFKLSIPKVIYQFVGPMPALLTP